MNKIQEIMGLVDSWSRSEYGCSRAVIAANETGSIIEEVEYAEFCIGLVKEKRAAIESKLRELVERDEQLRDDSCLLGFIETECLDVRCVTLGEDSYGWEIIQHHMGADPELKVGESFKEYGLREALEQAVGTITN